MDPATRPELNFPSYAFTTRQQDDRTYILDPVRKKYVRLTPEEWVRQHFIHFLITDEAYPAALFAIEKGFTYQKMPRRADVVVYTRQGEPWLMAECKAPEVPIGQDVFDQVAAYNRVIRAPYLVVTNGLDHYVCHIDTEQHTYTFLESVPSFPEPTHTGR